MKKIIFPAMAAMLLFASCKKDYTCTCKEEQKTVNQSGATIGTTTSTTTTEVKDVKKSFVKDKMDCYSKEYSYQTTPVFSDPVTVHVSTNCEITK